MSNKSVCLKCENSLLSNNSHFRKTRLCDLCFEKRYLPHITNITPEIEGLRLPHYAYSNQQITLEDCIYEIRYLPDFLMKYKHGILLEPIADKDSCLISSIRYEYFTIADWLDWDLLGYMELFSVLQQPPQKFYWPLANTSKAIHSLIKAICKACNWKHPNKISHLKWWIWCEYELCSLSLQSSGYYTGKSYPIGKSQAYKELLERDRYLDSLSTENLKETTIVRASPLEALIGLACLIARSNKGSPEVKKCFWDYRTSVKSSLRQLRDSPLSPIFVENDRIVTTKRGNNKLKKSL